MRSHVVVGRHRWGWTLTIRIIEITRPDPLVAPLLKGQAVGAVRVSLASGEPVTEVPLTVLESVEESGILGRAWDSLRLWIQ